MGRDGIAGLVCLAASLGLLATTIGLPGPSLLVPVGPGFYPRIILGITAALSAALLIGDIAKRRRQRESSQAAAKAEANNTLVLLVFAAFGVYIGLLPFLGFRISTFIFVTGLQALLEPPRTWRNWLLAAFVSLVTTVVTYYMFEGYLSVLLPRGRWTDF